HKMKDSNKPLVGVYTASDSIQLCQRCHPEVNTHPVGIEILPSASRRVLNSLPLGQNDMEGKIVCLTCHAVHQSAGGEYLLRGKQTSYGALRTSLCLHCHLGLFQRKSPHVEREKSCGFCHLAKPSEKAGQQSPSNLQMQASCDLCHNELEDSHYPGSNPFLDVDIRNEAIQSGLIPGNGQPVCTSCHDHHGKADGKGLLSTAFLALCSRSRSIDPHWNDYHCLSCHERQPIKGDAPLLEKGNYNALCNRCHGSAYARADIHPVGIKPSQHVRIPSNMPLENGLLTCATCHNSFMQVGCTTNENKTAVNLLFLRGKQRSRTSFCFLCHFEETYKLLNPHEQVNEQGQIKEETCLFCHSTLPDIKILGPEKVSFVVQNPDAYCIGCHHGFTRKHPAGIDHLTRPSEKILATLGTSIQRIGVELPLYKGQIVCATCHNPHETGVIKFSAAATGTKRDNKLRLMPGLMQCVGCHWDKR
ncbi:MAG: hypothetical protein KKH60_11430, partial [Proteobacteria bacterium]|nr:hypothetical protein [Pseudomonadota bacterium]